MVIEVGKLEKGCKDKVNFCEKLKLPKGSRHQEEFADVAFDGYVSNADGKYNVYGTIRTVLKFVCDRCLTDYDYTMQIDFAEVYIRGEASQEGDEIAIEGSKISIDNEVIADIVMNVPMKTVCRDDCKGLCYKCGQNLNISECGCDRTYVNPYFEDIKFFENDKEV